MSSEELKAACNYEQPLTRHNKLFAGFEIIQAEYLDTSKHLPQVALDGREATAIIAQKRKLKKP